MAKLITDGEFAEIRGVLNDVVDTFHEFTITFCQVRKPFDRFGEENEGKQVTKTALRCLVEFKQESEDAETVRTQPGTEDVQQLEVSFGIDYLETVNMMDANTKEAIFDRATDYFEYEGVKYRLIAMVADGPVKDKNVLIVITLEKGEKNAI